MGKDKEKRPGVRQGEKRGWEGVHRGRSKVTWKQGDEAAAKRDKDREMRRDYWARCDGGLMRQKNLTKKAARTFGKGALGTVFGKKEILEARSTVLKREGSKWGIPTR